MKKLLKKLAGKFKRPQRSAAWCAGCADSDNTGINANPHAPGTIEHADYEAGFKWYQDWYSRQW